jgi:RDD family
VLVGTIIFVVVAVVTRILGPTLRITTVDGVPRVSVDIARAAINAAVATLVTGLYFVGGWIVGGATPIQRLVGLRVRRASDAGRLALRPALLRWLVMGAPFGLISVVLLPWPILGAGLGVVVAAWYAVLLVSTVRGQRKRGIHDRVAGSEVVREVGLAVSGDYAASAE